MQYVATYKAGLFRVSVLYSEETAARSCDSDTNPPQSSAVEYIHSAYFVKHTYTRVIRVPEYKNKSHHTAENGANHFVKDAHRC